MVLELLLILQVALLTREIPVPRGELCAEGGRPHLVFVTDEGSITAELFEGAAPRTIRRMAELIRSPIDSDPPGGNLTFNYTRPRIEIITSRLHPGEMVVFENELDAEALGLHEDRIENAAEAMDVLQRELVPAFNQGKRTGVVHPRLGQWMAMWQMTMNTEFLVGVSRKEINEASGYVYTKGLDSRPVTKGALTLKPDSPTRSTARLGIALQDLPTRLGRQMVIGRVIEGLELADAISIRPLDAPPGTRSLDYAPRDPVVIVSVRVVCRE
jgi:cyclophilin family peptidyl-prolyl cis-trans isomerase